MKHPAGAHADRSTPYSPLAFRAFGFLVLPGFFDAAPLADEIDAVMQRGSVCHPALSGGISFQYVPMMTTGTPVSLSLLDRLEAVAADLLGGPVLPTRAKGVRYSGDTPWHVDSESPLRSIGFLAYLEPLGEGNGALRIVPGSHHPGFGDSLRALEADRAAAMALPAHAIATQPGDVIALDEHLYHASFGGDTRRQWRVDFLIDPVNADATALTRAYFADLYRPDWDGGYDVDRYPSYGSDWRTSARPAATRLGMLGVYDMAAAQEAFMRSRRPL